LLGALQTVPQVPQFEVSFLTSTHEPSQFSVPLAHATTHWPPVHTCPVPQRTPHLPQLSRFELVSTQALPHWV
jgi:hypothetical protein